VVVKTVPEAGSMKVSPGEFEIEVTFSKAMTDRSWSWCSVWDNSTPEGIGAPKYDDELKTCSLKVKLEPGKTYGYWINTKKFQNFRDQEGRSAVPYLLAFSTVGLGLEAETGNQYLHEQLKLAQADNYWAKFNLWEAYSQGQHDVPQNPAEAEKWLAELAKGAYLATFKPVNGFNPKNPGEMLAQFNEHCHLFSGQDKLGGASFFRTTKQDDKLIGSFLTETPDEFKSAIEQNHDLELISIEKVTPAMFLKHEASPQESL
jgi:RNA polymerase sigma-70 factor (ECF subfamily)